jgi:DNA-binding HxlR family transcriptional regulator
MSDPTKVFALSKVFHERARLGLMTLLVARREGVDFTELLNQLKLTKGNLALHLRKLEEEGYIKVHKGFVRRMPRTTYSVTPTGQRDFSAYLALLEEVIAGAREGD